MCGRYTLFHPEKLRDRFGTENELSDFSPSWNVAPGQTVPVITRSGPNRAEPMRWGLVPSWSKEPRTAYSTINARAETITEKPAYWGLVRSRRCLVPSTGFYEWKREAGGKVPYFFRLRDAELFAFAGLYDVWSDSQGSELRSFTVITVPANPLMAPVHDRMPAILDRDQEEAWLDIARPLPSDLSGLLRPYRAEAMEANPVSSAVNSPRNDGPGLIGQRAKEPAGTGGPNPA